jgi:hypothetical protein
MGVTLALLLVIGARAQAGPQYQYNATPGQSDVFSNNAADKVSKVSFSNEGEIQRDDDSNITATNLQTFSNQPSSNKAHFTDRSFTFSIALHDGWNLGSPGSLPTGVLTFHGFINDVPGLPSKVGLWNNGARLQYTITDPTQSITVGSHVFTVSFDPGPKLINGPGTNRQTSIDGQISVTNVRDMPEPSTAILSCLGLSFLGAFGYRRWKLAAC